MVKFRVIDTEKKIDSRIKRIWVEALRARTDMPIPRYLKTQYGINALGVLIEAVKDDSIFSALKIVSNLKIIVTPDNMQIQHSSRLSNHDDPNQSLPQAVLNALRLDKKIADFLHNWQILEKPTFSEIADWIEENL